MSYAVLNAKPIRMTPSGPEMSRRQPRVSSDDQAL